MCRITGIIDFHCKIPDVQQKINSMRDSMAHGGPDDAASYVNASKQVALGHRRLSILDLSSLGKQPMASEDETIWIVFNGEMYNFATIREELKKEGEVFKTNTDTEVIIKAYQKWQEHSFSKWIGMFAFSLYDSKQKKMFLVRDHAGIKPLYYFYDKDFLIFSSEVRAFKTFDPNWQQNPDWTKYFLLFGHIPQPYTTLNNVYMLPQGSYLELDLQDYSYKMEKYHQFVFNDKITNLEEAQNTIANVYTDSLARHLISDAPLGVFLSGGIDSSLCAIIASKFKKTNLKTLSIIFDEQEYSEKKYQQLVVDKISSQHQYFTVTQQDFREKIPDIFDAMDQPSNDGINTYFVSKCAHEMGLKAVISGLGGDELFGGYPSFERIKKVYAKPFRYMGKLASLLPDKYKRLGFLSIDNPLAYYLLFRGFFVPTQISKILGIKEQEIYSCLQNLYISDEYMPQHKQNMVSYLEVNWYMQNQLLKDSDNMGMWHAMEIRVPFLDREFMETVFSIAPETKFQQLQKTPKFLVSTSFAKELPPEIVYRPKQGFSFPFGIWLQQMGKDWFDQQVIHFDSAMRDKYWFAFANNKLHWSKLWSLIVMHKFLYAK